MEQITASAKRSKERASPDVAGKKKKSVSSETLEEISQNVIDYFKDSNAILITTTEELHEYIDKVIEAGECAIDTETTGLDRQHDTIVGTSIYYPGGVEAYIPCRHLIPIFDTPYTGQLTYEEVGAEYQRIVDARVKTVWANADFDLAMIYKDFNVDFIDVVYYDVISAWRVLKENEPDKALKVLYSKYVLKGKGDPKKFSDFFPPDLFQYCKPEIAKLYAAHDAVITYELKEWQMPYVTKTDPKCIKNNLQAVADLVWNVEMPMIKVCQLLHRNGMYVEKSMAEVLSDRYDGYLKAEYEKLYKLIDADLQNPKYQTRAPKPFGDTREFNARSTQHVAWLVYDFLGFQPPKSGKRETKKEYLWTLNYPTTSQIAEIRSLQTVISTFVEKLPSDLDSNRRLHGSFNSIGADTGRMSSYNPKTNKAYWG